MCDVGFMGELCDKKVKEGNAYIWTHPHWAGVTRISDNLHVKEMLVNFTRIRFESPALKFLNHCVEKIKVYFMSKP